jgi:hypothetical protein
MTAYYEQQAGRTCSSSWQRSGQACCCGTRNKFSDMMCLLLLNVDSIALLDCSVVAASCTVKSSGLGNSDFFCSPQSRLQCWGFLGEHLFCGYFARKWWTPDYESNVLLQWVERCVYMPELAGCACDCWLSVIECVLCCGGACSVGIALTIYCKA